jgi:ATP-dependent DNA helicase PIF1
MNTFELCQDQREVIKAFRDKRNVLLTGPAGTGKSVTLQAVVAEAKAQKIAYGITATTGAASVLIGGRTLHSFLGIGLATKDPKYLAEWIQIKYPAKAETLKALCFLIIDEVSMMSDELFDYISAFLKALRNNNAPFGGVKLLLSGDFAQLKSVKGGYAFQSKEWDRCDFKVVVLTTIFRQHGDTAFTEMLQRLRIGKCSNEDYATLKTRMDAALSKHVEPTRLYSLNADVERINATAFQKLLKTEKAIIFTTQFKDNKEESKRWAAASGIPESITLCNNAQVVVTCNVNPDEGVINGSRGRIVKLDEMHVVLELVNGSFATIGYHELSQKLGNERSVSARFMPLKLAYALSIHKSQGMTLDCVEIDLGDSIFEYGQAYVALSRARSLDSVRIVKLSKRAFRTHPLVLQFYKVG